ncbi:MAG: divalent cation tolerance protein CutA, partial [Anaerolineales bacterium]|nr:divalent cation tolerance protein CutA [Anaerolineales bacterium]
VPLVEEHHPYEVPEIIALPILKGSKSYLTWMEAETG